MLVVYFQQESPSFYSAIKSHDLNELSSDLNAIFDRRIPLITLLLFSSNNCKMFSS